MIAGIENGSLWQANGSGPQWRVEESDQAFLYLSSGPKTLQVPRSEFVRQFKPVPKTSPQPTAYPPGATAPNIGAVYRGLTGIRGIVETSKYLEGRLVRVTGIDKKSITINTLVRGHRIEEDYVLLKHWFAEPVLASVARSQAAPPPPPVPSAVLTQQEVQNLPSETIKPIDLVLEYATLDWPISAKEIVLNTGLNLNSVRVWLFRLRAKGLLSSKSGPTQAGIKHLEQLGVPIDYPELSATQNHRNPQKKVKRA